MIYIIVNILELDFVVDLLYYFYFFYIFKKCFVFSCFCIVNIVILGFLFKWLKFVDFNDFLIMVFKKKIKRNVFKFIKNICLGFWVKGGIYIFGIVLILL